MDFGRFQSKFLVNVGETNDSERTESSTVKHILFRRQVKILVRIKLGDITQVLQIKILWTLMSLALDLLL